MLDWLVTTGPECTVVDLATVTGQHHNTVREHLEALTHAGLADRAQAAASGRGRPAWVYTARFERLLGGRAREYAGLAAALAGHITRTSVDCHSDAITAGESWGADLAGTLSPIPANNVPDVPDVPAPARAGNPTSASNARRQLVDLLDELGFAPRSDTDATTVRLTRCPLLDVARRYPDVVCWVHLGVAKGVLRALGGDADRVDVHPFTEPGACRLDLPLAPIS